MKKIVVMLVAAFVAVALVLQHLGKKEAAEAVFSLKLRAAMQETSSPCTTRPMRLVEGAGRAAVVVGGRVFTDVSDIQIFPTLPVDGESWAVVDRPVALISTGEVEVIWLAYGTEACRLGLEREIKEYAITRTPNSRRPPWPVKKK